MTAPSKDKVFHSSLTAQKFAEVTPARQGLTIQNTSTAVLFIKWNEPPTATDHSVRMPANSYYETPFGFTGAIFGVWAAVNGQAIVTEL